MNDGFLSQGEIDALLKGNNDTSGDASSGGAVPAQEELISDIEKDALGEIGNISMGSAATALSVLLGRRVSITTPRVTVDTLRQVKEQYPVPYLVIEVGYTKGIEGHNVLAIHEKDALIISDLMMGGDGSNPPTELNELYMSAVAEAMNQMMGSVSTSMSTVFNKTIDISPPTVNLIDLAAGLPMSSFIDEDEVIVRVAFRIEVEGLIDSEIMQIMPTTIAKTMIKGLMGEVTATETPAAAPAAPVAAQPAPQQPVAPPPAAAAASMPQQAHYELPSSGTNAHVVQNVAVQPAHFAPLVPNTMGVSDNNIGLIMDVPLQVTVELGRTKKLIKDILELSSGSIIELDKLAGEPVDVLINGKLLAKGEVVVIDENFGVRITDIASKIERAINIQ